jgi:hypothetical protein
VCLLWLDFNTSLIKGSVSKRRDMSAPQPDGAVSSSEGGGAPGGGCC